MLARRCLTDQLTILIPHTPRLLVVLALGVYLRTGTRFLIIVVIVYCSWLSIILYQHVMSLGLSNNICTFGV